MTTALIVAYALTAVVAVAWIVLFSMNMRARSKRLSLELNEARRSYSQTKNAGLGDGDSVSRVAKWVASLPADHELAKMRVNYLAMPEGQLKREMRNHLMRVSVFAWLEYGDAS